MPRYWPILLALVAGAAAMFVGLQSSPETIEKWQLASRFTARAGFPFLIVTYVASSLVKLQPSGWTRALMHHRKYFGLGLAVTHTIHLVALVSFLNVLPEAPPIFTLLPGFTVFVVLYAMALTSNKWGYRTLGKNWKRLHSFGIHLIWLVFTVTYVAKIVDPEQQAVGGLFSAIAVLALLLRIAAWRNTHPERSSA